MRVRDAFVAALTFGLLYIPFLDHGRIPIQSLSTYVQRFRFNDPMFATLERAFSPQILAGVAVLVGLVTATWIRSKQSEFSEDKWAWPMAASLACAPVVYPWYLLWLLPFLSATSTLPLTVWTISILPTYFVWHLRTLGQEWIVPNWILMLEYGSVITTAAVVWLTRWPHPAVQASPAQDALPQNHDQRGSSG